MIRKARNRRNIGTFIPIAPVTKIKPAKLVWLPLRVGKTPYTYHDCGKDGYSACGRLMAFDYWVMDLLEASNEKYLVCHRCMMLRVEEIRKERKNGALCG